MTAMIDQKIIEQLLTEARSQNKWQERDISDEPLKQLVDILKMGPTSANCSPARFFFV